MPPCVHKARSIEKWFVKIGVEELDCRAQSPDLNLIEHLWDELERRLRARSNRLTSAPTSLILKAQRKQVLTAMFQNLVESLPRRVEAVIAAMFQHLDESLHQKSGGCYSSNVPTSVSDKHLTLPTKREV